jgi:CheY-like chemotaxis protein
VLTDVMMPYMNGFGLLKEIRYPLPFFPFFLPFLPRKETCGML